MDWNMFPQNSDVEDLNPSTSESDLIWSWSPYRSNQVKMRPLGCIWPKVRLVKAMVFPVVMYVCELYYKESWVLKNWCFWTGVLEKTLESPLNCKEILPVYPKGDQSWVFIGRTYVEAETPILWSPDVKSWFIGKDPDAGKDWGQEEETGVTEDEMVGWHRQLNGHEFEQTPGDSGGQRSLACCSNPWGCKELDVT